MDTKLKETRELFGQRLDAFCERSLEWAKLLDSVTQGIKSGDCPTRRESLKRVRLVHQAIVDGTIQHGRIFKSPYLLKHLSGFNGDKYVDEFTCAYVLILNGFKYRFSGSRLQFKVKVT